MKEAKIIRACIYFIKDSGLQIWVVPLSFIIGALAVGNIIFLDSINLFIPLLMIFLFGIQLSILIITTFEDQIIKRFWAMQILREKPNYVIYTKEGNVACSNNPPKDMIDGLIYNANNFVLANYTLKYIVKDFKGFLLKLKKKYKKDVYLKEAREFYEIMNSKVNTKADLVLFALKK